MTSSTYIPKRALFIYAHPDDIEFGVAGTAAVWAKHGCEVRYIILTDGNIGSHDPEMTGEKLAAIRRQEQSAAGEVAGIVECIYLGYPDGRLEANLEVRKELVRLIRKYRPNAVVSGDPTVFFRGDGYINHPDHRAAATAAIEAIFPSADSPLIFPELFADGYLPWKPNYVYISYPSDEPNYYVDISATLATKIEALKMHKSQMKEWDPTERITDWSAMTGKKVGFAHAEAYKRLTLREPKEDED